MGVELGVELGVKLVVELGVELEPGGSQAYKLSHSLSKHGHVM